MPSRARKTRRPKGRKSNTIRSIVSRVVDRKIKKNTELKHFDTSIDTTYDFAGTMYDLSAVAQGDIDNQRDGDKLTPKGLNFHYNASVADASNYIRVIIFHWKQNNISVSPTGSYLVSPFQSSVNAVLAPYNWDTRMNYKILKDFVIRLNSSDRTTANGHFYLSLKSLPKVAFDSGTTSGSNHIYMFVVSDSGAATHPGLRWISRLSFVDS